MVTMHSSFIVESSGWKFHRQTRSRAQLMNGTGNAVVAYPGLAYIFISLVVCMLKSMCSTFIDVRL